MAVAGLIVSLVGLILSIAIVGGLFGIVGGILSFLGLRRARGLGGKGRGVALGGIVLSILSIVAAVGFTLLLLDAVNGGPEIVRDGISTRSRNTEFPPQDDIVDVRCESSDGGGLALAIVEIENRSPETSSYAVTVEWDTADGTIEGRVGGNEIEPGATSELRLFERSGDGEPETCVVTMINRSSFALFTE